MKISELPNNAVFFMGNGIYVKICNCSNGNVVIRLIAVARTNKHPVLVDEYYDRSIFNVEVSDHNSFVPLVSNGLTLSMSV